MTAYPYGTVVEDDDGEVLMLTGVVSKDDLPEDRVADALVLVGGPDMRALRLQGDVGSFVPVMLINRSTMVGTRYKVLETA